MDGEAAKAESPQNPKACKEGISHFSADNDTIYHFHVGHISRGSGASAMAAAAYRAGEELTSEYYGERYDYTRKGGVVFSEILLPSHAPPEYTDRETLWNAVEKAERRKDAQLAYSFDIALQNEFTMDENEALVKEYLLKNFISRGMIADYAIHQPEKDGIQNPHFHVMCPIRPLNKNGTWGTKQKREYLYDENNQPVLDDSGHHKYNAVHTTDWSDRETLEEWRRAWAELCNRKFEKKGLTCRIDHRSYKEQGIDQTPTVHEGIAVREMEKRGIRTDKGERNRVIRYYKCVSVKKKRAECHKKSVKKAWIEDLVIRETMGIVIDDARVEAIVSKVMELQSQESSSLPLFQQQLRETESAIENILNAIQRGILTMSTKSRLEELEATKETLEVKIACEKMAKPKLTDEQVRHWIVHFRMLDMAKKEHRQKLIDTFVNAIYLYDDKAIIVFNYKEDSKTVDFTELNASASGSDMESSAVPKKVVDFDRKSTTFFLCQNALISRDFVTLPHKETRPGVISGTGFSCFRRSQRAAVKV